MLVWIMQIEMQQKWVTVYEWSNNFCKLSNVDKARLFQPY